MKKSNNYKPPLLLKRLFQLLGLIALSAGVAMFYLENSFPSHQRVPRPEWGWTVAYPFKGAVFYITPDEYFWIRLIHFVFTIGVVGGLGIGIYIWAKKGFPARGVRNGEGL